MPTKLILALLAILVLVTLVALPFAELFTEWLWFGEVGYQSVFIKSLAAKGLLGLLAFVGTFAMLFANLRLAVRGPNRPYTVFAGGGDIQPIVLEQRHLSLLAAGISGAVAVVVALVVANPETPAERDQKFVPGYSWDASHLHPRWHELTAIGRHNYGSKLLVYEIAVKWRFPGVLGPSKWGGLKSFADS